MEPLDPPNTVYRQLGDAKRAEVAVSFLWTPTDDVLPVMVRGYVGNLTPEQVLVLGYLEGEPEKRYPLREVSGVVVNVKVGQS